ncbi:MAG: TolC family protein [Bdellovibrionota bacterium]
MFLIKKKTGFFVHQLFFVLPIFFCFSFVQAQECELTREKTLHLMEQNNLQTQITHYQMEKSEYDAEYAKAIYDQQLAFGANHTLDKSDRIVSFMGTKDEITSFSARYQKAFPTGTLFSTGLRTTRQFNNGPFTTVNPAFNTIANFSIQQPLLNNAFGQGYRQDVAMAQMLSDSQTMQLQRTQQQISLEALFQYWDWIAKKMDLVLIQEATQRAQDFVKITGKQFQYGTSENTDVYAAKSNHLSQVEDQTRAENDVAISFNTLVNTLRLQDLPTKSCQSLDLQRLYTKVDYTLLSNVEKAQASRTDRKALEKSLEAFELKIKRSKNQNQPDLNLLASLDLNAVNTDWDSSVGETFSSYHPKWFVGAELVVPLEKRRQKAEWAQAQLDEKIAKTQLQQLDLDLYQSISNKVIALQSLEKRIEAIAEVVEFEQKKLVSAKRNYELGRQTALTVILYQQDLIRVHRKKLALELEYRLTLEELNFIRGELQ